MLRFLVLILLNILILKNAFSENLKEISVCWFDSYKSMSFLKVKESKNSTVEVSGFMGDFINKAFLDHGVTLKHYIYPTKRCLNEIKYGRIDIIPFVGKSKERNEIALFNNVSIAEIDRLFVYLKTTFREKPKLDKIDDLKKYTFGGIFGYGYDFFNNQINIDIGARNQEQLYEKLNHKRFDIALDNLATFLSQNNSKTIDFSKFEFIPNKIAGKILYYVMVSKKNPNSNLIIKYIDEYAINNKKKVEVESDKIYKKQKEILTNPARTAQ